ncbi:putative regulator of ribonuclease activity [compost metagenome]
MFGVIRDSGAIGGLDIGVKALGVCPRKTDKLGEGERDVDVEFGGIRIRPGDWLCADEDGVVVADTDLR